MEVPLRIYLNIAAVGTCALVLLSHFSPLKEWRRALVGDRVLLVSIAPLWALLLWPRPEAEAFKAGEDIGSLRIARVVVFAALFVWGFGYSSLRRRRLRQPFIRAYWAYIAICVASAAYSPSPAETLWKSAELILTAMLARVWVARQPAMSESPERLVRAILYATFIVVLFSLVGILMYPDVAFAIQGGERDISSASAGGILPQVNANNLGQLAGTLLVTAVMIAIDGRPVRKGVWVVGAVGLAALIAAHSRTSLVASVLVLALVLTVQRRFRALALVGVLGAGVLIAQSDVILAFFSRGQDVDTLKSMTGRRYLWSVAWSAFLDDPWFGKGFYAGHKTLPIAGLGQAFSSVDNTYLESLVNVGIVGTAFLIAYGIGVAAAAIRMAHHARSCTSGPSTWEMSAPLVISGFVLVRSFTGPTFQALHVNVTMMLVCAAVASLWRETLLRCDQGRALRRGSPMRAPRAVVSRVMSNQCAKHGSRSGM